MATQEVNFDGLVGPTHNFAGLSQGNVASMKHGGRVSHPRQAALQGLAKMKALADLGLPQAVLPPHERPDVAALRALGFAGSDAAVLTAAARESPALLAACASASAMWVANAATVSPSPDTADGRVHFTPANLVAKPHRSIEPPQTARTLRAIFRDPRRFVVHEPVSGGGGFGDEGAANHTRFVTPPGEPGLHFFVYGHRAVAKGAERGPRRFASRQALEASQAVARQHGLDPDRVVYARQHPGAVDAGVFHNDVIAVGHENVLFCHEQAYAGGTRAIVAELARRWRRRAGGAEFVPTIVPSRRVPLAAAVRTYLFNSQLVTVAPGRMVLIAPAEVRREPRVSDYVEELVGRAHTPLRAVRYFDLRQSMSNGGGPACLRLRVVLTADERAVLPAGVWINDATYPRLVAWVKKHYRETLRARDLADPHLLEESRRALDELTQSLGLGSIYPFQRAGA
ncbi:MAG TPA: N-succinylarginine dihydrolase [Opitutaceae bacterium]|nr:N-succinylarginine dihydrolase [Opitutaceae bacterium]